MHETIAKILARCNADTKQQEPDWLVIHSLNHVQHASWDAWAIQQAEMLKRHGWRERRIGTALHLVPEQLIGETVGEAA